MSEPVELRFTESGVDPVTKKVNALADAFDRLPKSGIVRVTGSGGGSGPQGGGSAGSSAPMPSSRAMQAQAAFMAQKPTQGAQGAVAYAQAQAKMTVQVKAAAVAAAQSGGSIQGLAGALAQLHPAAAAAVGIVTAAAEAFLRWQAYTVAGGVSNFLYGPQGGASARGMAASLGGEANSGPERIQHALDSDPRARAYANAIGVNPNGNPQSGGDTDAARKMHDLYSHYGDPHKVNDATARDFARHFGAEEDIARLRNSSDEGRRKILDSKVFVDPKDAQKATDADSQWNRWQDRLKRGTRELLDLTTGGPIIHSLAQKALNWLDQKLIDGDNAAAKTGEGKGGAKGAESAADKMNTAADKMVGAVNTFSHVADGVYGGGKRMRGAIPSEWGMDGYSNKVYEQAGPLGVL